MYASEGYNFITIKNVCTSYNINLLPSSQMSQMMFIIKFNNMHIFEGLK